MNYDSEVEKIFERFLDRTANLREDLHNGTLAAVNYNQKFDVAEKKAKTTITNLIAQEANKAVLNELLAVKDKSESHLNTDGRTMRRAYIEDRIAQLTEKGSNNG